MPKVPFEKCLHPALVEQFPEPANGVAFWQDFHTGIVARKLEKKYAVDPLWCECFEKNQAPSQEGELSMSSDQKKVLPKLVPGKHLCCVCGVCATVCP